MGQDDLTHWQEELQRSLKIMEVYLALRLSMRDWHGVMDAAADIREIESKIATIKELMEAVKCA
jgi:hypothetical protein